MAASGAHLAESQASAEAREVANLHKTLAVCPTPDNPLCAICKAARERLAELAEPVRGDS